MALPGRLELDPGPAASMKDEGRRGSDEQPLSLPVRMEML